MNKLYTTFNYLIEIDGVATGGFSECSILNTNTEPIDYSSGSDEITLKKMSGLKEFLCITFNRGITRNRELWKWMKTSINESVERKNGIITLLNETEELVCKWRFINGWPTKLIGPSMTATSNEVAIEVLEIAHEGLTRIE